MHTMLKNLAVAGALALALLSAPAFAQTIPNLTQNQKLTPAQWNNLFASKQDTLGYIPLNSAGGTMTGRLITAVSGATTAGLNLTPGTAPASPANGDLWTTSAGIYVRINGSTVGPLISGALPAFTFGTGAASTITASSANTGFTNSLNIINSGTSSNSSTVANSVVSLGCSNCFANLYVQGGTSPSANLQSGAGVTGGFNIAANAGTLSITNPTISTPTFTFGTGVFQTISAFSANTGNANAFLLNNSGTISTSGTAAAVYANLSSAANSYIAMFAQGGATPTASLTSGSAMTGGMTISVGAGVLNLSSPNLATPSITLGSDATGDIWYRNSGGQVARLPIGSAGQALTVSGGLPVWAAVAGTGTVTSAAYVASTGMSITGTTPCTTTCTWTIAVDKATAANYYAGTSNKVVTTDIIYPAEVTITYGATTTFDFSTFINGIVTLTGNITTQTFSNVTAGKSGSIRYQQSGAGSFTTVWNSILKWPGGSAPSLTTGSATAIDVLTFNCVSATYCQASLAKDVK
jgi:hypothetical protein